MRKFSSISKNNNITNITIGKFDSIHLAHKALIDLLDSNGAVLIIASKNRHLGTNSKQVILPQKHKKRLISKPIFFINFKKIKDLSGANFLKYLQKKLPKLQKIIVGEDFCFGKNRHAKASDIPKISSLKVEMLKEIKIAGIPVHSQNIRDFIANGKIKLANRLLGRDYSIKGRIVRGQGLGKAKLVPTINIVNKKYLLPQSAVYASKVRIKNKVYDSVTFLGHRLSADNNFAIESHILGDFEVDSNAILGRKIEIIFIDKIRENHRFERLDLLKRQISSDIKKAKAILKANAESHKRF